MIANLPFFGEVKKQVTTYNLHASSMIKMFSIYGIKVTTIFWGHNGGQNSQNGGVFKFTWPFWLFVKYLRPAYSIYCKWST